MRVAAVLALVCLLGAATPVIARAQQPERISVQAKNLELARLIDRLAPALGERFIYDSSLAGRVTIAVPRPVSRDEAFQLLHVALALRGFAALPIPAGGYKIVQLRFAADSDPWTMTAPSPTGESRILTMIQLQEVDVNEILGVIQPLLDATTIAIPSASNNALLLATSERRVAAIAALVGALDARDATKPVLRPLRERDAATALDVIEARYAAGDGRFHGVSAWIDERTNTVIYRAPAAKQREIASMLDELDQPTEMSGEIRVIRLRHATASTIAEHILRLSGQAPAAGGEPSALSGQSLHVVADTGTQSLVVNAAPEVIEAVLAVVAQLDRPPRQIEVDVLVQEWVYDDDFNVSINSSAIVGTNPAAAITSQSRPGGFLSETLDDSLAVTVSNLPQQIQLIANQTEVDAVTLLRPHLVVMSGEEQVLFRGDNVPVPTAETTTAGGTSGFSQSTNIERHDVGIELRLRASIGEGYSARLAVQIDIESLRSSLAGPVEQVGPTFQLRNVETTVDLLPGQALLIAGDTEGFTKTTRRGIPFIMDIPFVGGLFSAYTAEKKRGRIVVAVQARALPDSDALLARSIQRRIGFERARTTAGMLDAPSGMPYSLRLATVSSRRKAIEVARSYESEVHPAQVVAWTGSDIEYFDVHLLGFVDYLEAADEAFRLHGLGVLAQVVPVDGVDPTMLPPAFRNLPGSDDL